MEKSAYCVACAAQKKLKDITVSTDEKGVKLIHGKCDECGFEITLIDSAEVEG